MLRALLLCIGWRWRGLLGNLVRARLGSLNELGDARLHSLIRGQLRFGVELELAAAPAERTDDRGVAGHTVALRVEEVTEQEVQGSRLP